MSETHQILITSLRVMMRPLARFCLRNALRLQDILECSKVALIFAAAEVMEDAGEKVTASRLSAMTGIHRRDVNRIYKRNAVRDTACGTISKILGQWQHDRRFIDRSGRPRVLTAKGDSAEFNQLVRIVSKDLHPGTILFELERVGTVRRVGDSVELVSRVWAPRKNDGQILELLSHDTSDMIDAVLDNITSDETPPNLHAKTDYDKIRADAVPSIREWFIAEGAAFHARARNFLSKFDLDITPDSSAPADTVRVALGTFSLVEKSKERKPT